MKLFKLFCNMLLERGYSRKCQLIYKRFGSIVVKYLIYKSRYKDEMFVDVCCEVLDSQDSVYIPVNDWDVCARLNRLHPELDKYFHETLDHDEVSVMKVKLLPIIEEVERIANPVLIRDISDNPRWIVMGKFHPKISKLTARPHQDPN